MNAVAKPPVASTAHPVVAALYHRRFDEIAELAECAVSNWHSIAATRGKRLTVETHCRQVALATRAAFGAMRNSAPDQTRLRDQHDRSR